MEPPERTERTERTERGWNDGESRERPGPGYEPDYGYGPRRYGPQGYGRGGYDYNELFNREFAYPGRLGALGSIFLLLAVCASLALMLWIFVFHGVNHAIANEGQVNAIIRIFSYILTVFVFDWAMLKAARLVERPRDWRQRQLMSGPRHHHHHGPHDHHPSSPDEGYRGP